MPDSPSADSESADHILAHHESHRPQHLRHAQPDDEGEGDGENFEAGNGPALDARNPASLREGPDG